jgi:hypothetical protein
VCSKVRVMLITTDRFAVAIRLRFLLNSNCGAKPGPLSESGPYNSYGLEKLSLP